MLRQVQAVLYLTSYGPDASQDRIVSHQWCALKVSGNVSA
jgi:hypothetical protein